MSGATTLGVVHATASLAALGGAWVVARAHLRALDADPDDVRRGPGTDPAVWWLVVTLAAAAVWSGHLAWWEFAGGSTDQLLWLPSVSATMGGLLVWTVSVLRPEQVLPRLRVPLWLCGPVLLVVAQLTLGSQLVERTDHVITYGWFYSVHVLIAFAMMLATASLWAGVRADPSRTLRVLARLVIAGLLGAGVAQVMGLMVLDLVLVVAGLAVVTLVLATPGGALRPTTSWTHARTDRAADDDGPVDEVADLAATLDAQAEVVALGATFLGADDAHRAVATLRIVLDPLTPLAIALLDDHSFVALVPAQAEPHLEDAAEGWQRPTTDEADATGPISISLSPLLAATLVTRCGTAARLPELVTAVRRDLASLTA